VTQHFDAIIVGAGQAGPPLAGRLTSAGQTVAMVERKLFGGTCVNTGCIPTKTLVASAYAAHLARRGADFGVSAGPVSVDMSKVKARKDGIVLDDRNGASRAFLVKAKVATMCLGQQCREPVGRREDCGGDGEPSENGHAPAGESLH